MVTGAARNPVVANGQDTIAAVRRWWWLIAAALAGSLAVGFLLTPVAPWTATFRATVLIPGDTEDTGSAERPELMVLDDLGPFVESWAFAEAVAGSIGGEVAAGDVHGMLDGSRYSRVATVTVSGDDRAEVLAVANAAADVFPEQVNAYLVAPGTGQATVQVIDPPREPGRDAGSRWLRVAAIGVIGAAAATVAIVLLTPSRRPGAP